MVGEDFETVSEAKKQKVATYASELKNTLLEASSFYIITFLELASLKNRKG